MALKKVKGNLERMFDKNLSDLVRGIRNNKDNEGKYIAQCMEEIKQELRQDNISVKANAVAKLIYLQMLGYDISWAGFNIIEVMSSNKLTFKRIGYLGASQSFHPDSELLMLTTNMIRKDLNSQNQYDAGLALSGLSCFVSTDLAKDLANDIMTLLSSTKPYIRKKAVLMMYKIFLRFPEALRPAFPRLKEKLEDPDSGVQSACVNVVCELARKNPRNYLSLAPVFFKLMTTSTNNWMLIKIIKLFGALTPLEPRLGKKLIEPLTNLIHSTSAMSLLYECINTVIAVLISISSGMPTHSASIQLCVQKLRILIEDSDQNLKYLGLLAMSKILITHPKSVQAHKDLILQCLDDKDESIRLRALDLLYGMVSKKNLMEIVKKLMVHMDKAEGTSYRDQLLSKIIQICSQNNYQHITNFEWYVSVLVDVTRMEGSQKGPLIADQMMDVALRVKAIRGFCVEQMSLLLENAQIIAGSGCSSSNMTQVLYAAAWICGEFASELPNPRTTLEALLNGKGVTNLPGHIQAVYIQNILKIFSLLFTKGNESGDLKQVTELCELICDKLPEYVSSADLEVQERASSALHLMKFVQKHLEKNDGSLAVEMASLFAGELNPVAPKAQKKVQIPEGLDLDAWINEPLSSESSSDGEEFNTQIFSKCEGFGGDLQSYGAKKKSEELTEEELNKRRMARKLEQANNLYYLKSEDRDRGDGICNNIPVQNIELDVPLKIPGLTTSDKYLKVKKEKDNNNKKSKKKTKKSKKGRKEISSEDENPEPLVIVNTAIGEMPEGAIMSDGENDDDDDESNNDPHKALDINLDEPLREEEKLPVPTHRTSLNLSDDKSGKEKEGKSGSSQQKMKNKNKKDNKDEKVRKKKENSNKEKKKKKGKDDTTERERGEEEKDDGKQSKTGGKGENIDFWLLDDSAPSRNYAEVESNEYEDMTKTKHKKKKKKGTTEKKTGTDDKTGRMKKTKRMSKDKQGGLLLLDENPNGDDSSILAKENLLESLMSSENVEKRKSLNSNNNNNKNNNINNNINNMNNINNSMVNGYQDGGGGGGDVTRGLNKFSILGKDDIVKLMYDIRVVDEMRNHLMMILSISNRKPGTQIRDMILNISESGPIQLLREPGTDRYDDIKIDCQLIDSQQTKETELNFIVSDCSKSHKIRGTFTYKHQDPGGVLSQDKIDFWLRFPVSRLLSNYVPSQMEYSALLSGGTLSCKQTFRIENQSFSQVLDQVCERFNLKLIEKVDETAASLFSRTLTGQNVCILIKSGNLVENPVVSLDGKSESDMFLFSLFEEIKSFFVS
ncbi:AP-3 complex subunit delta-1, putative [Pediculus humanus corporis]|uniref:AP-3 complex subunit delta n=1 Tax=Pediculus humanus subsp. corporis TaxID=121224 RepID=E0VFE0_PEDHC|nr:AP-3 complex subunit delta-1, putative [Pediculus humanus corporis]EEB12096.1 AP-3 complex subunit delta-1, putative [Pediculus humanus corporis]